MKKSKVIVLKKKPNVSGGMLGYEFIKLINYHPKARIFDTITDVGFQKIHKLELLPYLEQYREVHE